MFIVVCNTLWIAAIGAGGSPNATAAVTGEGMLAFFSFAPDFPDDRTIQDAPLDLVVVNPDGSNPQVLVFEAAMRGYCGMGLAWSPDGSQLAYASGGELWIVNADGTDNHKVTNICAGNIAWSPTGEWLALEVATSTAYRMWLVRPDGTGGHFLGECEWIGGHPTFSPDGATIATINSPCLDDPVHNWGIFGYSTSTGQQVVRYADTNTSGVIPDSLDWSPDGSHLITTYRTNRDNGSCQPGGYSSSDIYMIEASQDSEPVRVGSSIGQTDLDEQQATWSPSGERIAFSAMAKSCQNGQVKFGDEGIYVVNDDGSGTSLVYEPAGELPVVIGLDWQPCSAAAAMCSSPSEPILDADADEVADYIDSCPQMPGPASNFGCPPDVDPIDPGGPGGPGDPSDPGDPGDPGDPWVSPVGIIPPNGRLCFPTAGQPGDVALVNLTPVLATGAGNGQLLSSDVVDPPTASNVNFGPDTVDPNVAASPIGVDGRVCYQNSHHSSVHLIADHLGTISRSAYTLADPSGAPKRVVDTRVGLGGGLVGPNERVCFAVAGNAGDIALVNLTPVEARGSGNGQLISSDITTAPVASNVNFGPGTVDPNVAAAPIGAAGAVCFQNSTHTAAHFVADHLGTIARSAYTLADPSGAPKRIVDTRFGVGGGLVGPNARVCFGVSGAAGDVAIVNLTPVEPGGAGNGQLISSDITTPPVASNVNYGPGRVDPNVAAAPIGADGQVCFVNSRHTTVHLIADHLGTISRSDYTLADPTGAPVRSVDTRG